MNNRKIINIVLAEDHCLVRKGIKMLLEIDDQIQVVGEAVNGLEVMAMIKAGLQVDIVLSDINMPEMDGFSLVLDLHKKYPEVKVIALSMLDNELNITKIFSSGASGYLLKSIGAEELTFAIKHVYGGKTYISSDLSHAYVGRSGQLSLSKSDITSALNLSSREREILHLIAEGYTNAEMSERLFLSKRTVEGHRLNLLEKTASRNTAMLIRYAVANGIVN